MENMWVRCTNCHHKLFMLNDKNIKIDISIKCHSCKSIENIKIDNLTKK